MISKTIGFRGLAYFQTNPFVDLDPIKNLGFSTTVATPAAATEKASPPPVSTTVAASKSSKVLKCGKGSVK